MKLSLSEAGRLGAMIRPQAYNWYFIDGRSCFMGAALEAVGWKYRKSQNSPSKEWTTAHISHWSWIAGPGVCPSCGRNYSRTDRMLFHLNNDHRWTRERIADFVATIEPADAPAPVAREEVEA